MNDLLEKVKDDFAQGRGSESWGRYSLLFSISLEDIDEIAIRFAKAVAEKAVKEIGLLESTNPSYNAALKDCIDEIKSHFNI